MYIAEQIYFFPNILESKVDLGGRRQKEILFHHVHVCLGVFGSVNGNMLGMLPIYALTTTLYRLSDTLLNSGPWLNNTNTCSFPAPWLTLTTSEPTIKESSVQISKSADYVGTYKSQIMAMMLISVNPKSNTSLSFKLGRLWGLLHSTDVPDNFLSEITWPLEFAIPYKEDMNSAMYTKYTFIRKDSKVVRVIVTDSVDIVFTKF